MKILTAALSMLLSLSTTTTAAPVKRQLITADTLIQDIYNIHNGVLANQAATSSFNGGNIATSLISGTPVLATVGAIHVANRKGFYDANLSGPINESDSERIVAVVRDTVAQSIPSAVDTIVGKKSAFEASGQSQVVLASLKLLLNDHDTFSAALEQMFYTGDAALTAEAVELVAKIHDAIQGGIDAYSS